MKKLLFFIFTVSMMLFAKDVYVGGYYRSSSNNTKIDNWTTKGNRNPHTYEKGTREYYTYNNYGHYKKKEIIYK